ncbi:hypothetical protein CLF_111754 [Clonorchis sinensis]|uniref:Uncharacterized protein n=1 Tax=Clonorchis sinensis TaxID=79923 RepID=G7YVA7_CLOSI|nr:hypothetical protein CLF_111754 [Clonorchis sinensis]
MPLNHGSSADKRSIAGYCEFGLSSSQQKVWKFISKDNRKGSDPHGLLPVCAGQKFAAGIRTMEREIEGSHVDHPAKALSARLPKTGKNRFDGNPLRFWEFMNASQSNFAALPLDHTNKFMLKCVHVSIGGDSANIFVVHVEDGSEDITRMDDKMYLGIWLSSNMSSLHHEESPQKAFVALRMLRHTFSRITCTDFQILCGAQVRPLLEYDNHVIYRRRTKGLILDERVQGTNTKRVIGLKSVDYEVRRVVHDFLPLEHRRFRGGPILTYALLEQGLAHSRSPKFQKTRGSATGDVISGRVSNPCAAPECTYHQMLPLDQLFKCTIGSDLKSPGQRLPLIDSMTDVYFGALHHGQTWLKFNLYRSSNADLTNIPGDVSVTIEEEANPCANYKSDHQTSEDTCDADMVGFPSVMNRLLSVKVIRAIRIQKNTEDLTSIMPMWEARRFGQWINITHANAIGLTDKIQPQKRHYFVTAADLMQRLERNV